MSVLPHTNIHSNLYNVIEVFYVFVTEVKYIHKLYAGEACMQTTNDYHYDALYGCSQGNLSLYLFFFAIVVFLE